MPLPPLSFSAPPRQRSVIEEAFGQALSVLATQAISAPFEKRRERRALENEKALQQSREDIRFANLPREMDLQYNDWLKRSRAAAAEEIANIGPVAEAKARATLAARGVLRTANVEPATERIIDRVQNLIGGFSAGDIAKPTSVAELDEMGPLLNTAIAAGNLSEERNRTQLQRESMRDIREANLFPPLTEDDLGLAFINTETGNPLSTLDIQLMKAGVRGQITTAPGFEKYKARSLELQRLREEGKLQQVQFTGKNMQTMLGMFTGSEAGQALMQSARSYPFLMWKSPDEQIDIGNAAETTGWMAGNRDLMEALAASQLNRDMNQVIQAEKTGVAPQLSSRALGYLSLIYAHFGRPYEHPRAILPEEIPEKQLREIGQTRIRSTSSIRAGVPDSAAGGGNLFAAGNTTNVLQGRGPLFAGLNVSVAERERYPEYLDLQQGLQTMLRTGPGVKRGGLAYDSTLYKTIESDFIQSHATPEKAYKFYHDLGVPDVQLRGLLEGDSASKQLELDNRLRFSLGALQTARDAITAK